MRAVQCSAGCGWRGCKQPMAALPPLEGTTLAYTPRGHRPSWSTAPTQPALCHVGRAPNHSSLLYSLLMYLLLPVRRRHEAAAAPPHQQQPDVPLDPSSPEVMAAVKVLLQGLEAEILPLVSGWSLLLVVAVRAGVDGQRPLHAGICAQVSVQAHTWSVAIPVACVYWVGGCVEEWLGVLTLTWAAPIVARCPLQQHST